MKKYKSSSSEELFLWSFIDTAFFRIKLAFYFLTHLHVNILSAYLDRNFKLNSTLNITNIIIHEN